MVLLLVPFTGWVKISGKIRRLVGRIFCIIATVLITAMGIPMLRINKMKEKWRVKLAQALIKSPENKKNRFKLGYLWEKVRTFYFAIHHLLA